MNRLLIYIAMQIKGGRQWIFSGLSDLLSCGMSSTAGFCPVLAYKPDSPIHAAFPCGRTNHPRKKRAALEAALFVFCSRTRRQRNGVAQRGQVSMLVEGTLCPQVGQLNQYLQNLHCGSESPCFFLHLGHCRYILRESIYSLNNSPQRGQTSTPCLRISAPHPGAGQRNTVLHALHQYLPFCSSLHTGHFSIKPLFVPFRAITYP